MENSSKDYQKWNTVGQLPSRPGGWVGGQVIDIIYDGSLKDDCFYCLKMDTPDGFTQYSIPYKSDGDAYAAQPGLETGDPRYQGDDPNDPNNTDPQDPEEDDDDDTNNKRRKNSATKVFTCVAGVIGVVTFLIL